ncbi:MAG: hypothetical protein H6547_01075 [Chitinophagales bacterium]|nr:hypothetical protein [Chitinophagales bacterium]
MHRILSCTLALLTTTIAFAQEWNLQKGEGKIFGSFSYLQYDKIADDDGNFIDSYYHVNDRTYTLSGSYGITEKFTIYGQVPFKSVGVNHEIPFQSTWDGVLFDIPDGGDLNALGNVTAGAAYALIPQKLTASLTLEANTSTQNYIDGTATGFNSSAVIPGIAWIHGTNKWWSSVLVQGEWRTNNYSSVLAGRAEAGLHLTNWLYVAAQPAWRIPLNESDADCDCTLAYTALYLNEQSYVSMQLKTGVEYRNWGLHLASGNAFYVRNVGLNLALTGGLSYHFTADRSSNE